MRRRLALIIAVLTITAVLWGLTSNSKIPPLELVNRLYPTMEPPTILGDVKKPAFIYQDKEGGFHAYSYNGEGYDLGFSIKTREGQTLRFDTDRPGYNTRQIYFDKFSDRVYFIKNKLYCYDINKKSLQEVQLEIELDELQLAGVHNNYVVLRPKGGYAASANFLIADMVTGKLVENTATSQAEYYQLYEFKGPQGFYGLHVHNKKGITNLAGLSYNVARQDMKFYLEKIEGINDVAQEIPPDHLEFVFGWHKDLLIPPGREIFSLRDGLAKDDYMKRNNNAPGKRYRVRGLYRLKEEEVVLEINNKLIVVNLKTSDTRVVLKGEALQILKEAIPLAPPIENLFSYYYNVTEDYPFTNVPPEVKDHFVANLE